MAIHKKKKKKKKTINKSITGLFLEEMWSICVCVIGEGGYLVNFW